MGESPRRAKDLVMGRADVLLRFLQLIGKDRPKDLDPYVDGLDSDTEQRPLVDQIVDRIIAGDPALYVKYAQARREVGLRNPYASPEDERETVEYDEAVGRFITRWTTFESALREHLQASSSALPEGQARATPAHLLVRFAGVPESLRGELEFVRRLRNQVVHGIERPPAELLFQASSLLEQAHAELTDSQPRKKGGSSRGGPARKAKRE